jgi:S-adenosyl-L-methionine hydrolase (adenosine-forming)
MPFITLSTDFGLKSFVVPAIKGLLYQVTNNVTLVDVGHQFNMQRFLHTGYVLKNILPHFPEATVHLVLINVFEKPTREFVFAKVGTQYVICPNNGLLPGICDVDTTHIALFKIAGEQGNTIMGCVTHIASMLTNLYRKSQPIHSDETIEFDNRIWPQPLVSANAITAQIVSIDEYQNVIVNITEKQFNDAVQGRPFEIALRGASITTISKHYADVGAAQAVAFFNSANYLELAVNGGNFASLFGFMSSDSKLPISLKALENQVRISIF